MAETGAAPVGEQAARFATASSSIDVEVLVKQGSGPGGLYELLRTAKGVAPAVVPDLLILNHVDLIAAAREGLLQPLDAYLPPDSGYFPTALDSVSTAEALWAFPYVATAEQMAYIATDAVTPTPPITWTGILSGSYAMALPGAPVDGLASDVLLSMYMGSGGRVLDDKSLPTLERATLRQVYGFLLELRSAGLLDADQVLGIADTAGCWNALLVEDSPSIRLAPVAVSEYWRPSLATLAGVGIEETPQPESTRPANIRPSWAPTESGDPITVMRTWGLAVTTEDPVRLDAALELIRWLVSAQHMADLTRTAAVVPTRRQAVETWGLAADQEAFLLALLSSGVSPPVDGAEVVVRRALQSGLTALLQGEAPTADAAASQALASLRR